MAEVSVVIPSRNEEETIRGCIEKVKSAFGSYHTDGEILNFWYHTYSLGSITVSE